MLICFKSHRGGLNLNVEGVNVKLSGYGLIDNIDDNLYQKAKKIYGFLTDWEKDGIIEIGQKDKQDKQSLEVEKAEQKKAKKSNKEVTERA